MPARAARRIRTDYALDPAEREAVDRLLRVMRPTRHKCHLGLHVRYRDGTASVFPLTGKPAEIVYDVFRALAKPEGAALVAPGQFVSPAQAAALLGISRTTLRRRMDQGLVAWRQVGKHRRLSAQTVLALRREWNRVRGKDGKPPENDALVAALSAVEAAGQT